jgi:hypothetical protein
MDFFGGRVGLAYSIVINILDGSAMVIPEDFRCNSADNVAAVHAPLHIHTSKRVDKGCVTNLR